MKSYSMNLAAILVKPANCRRKNTSRLPGVPLLFSILTLGMSVIATAVNAANPSTLTPTVSIASPASGTTYTTANTVTITASATANSKGGSITKVEFYDGGVLKATDTTSPYSYGWALTSANNGTHTWTAKAYDSNGNTAQSSAVNLTANIPTTYTITTSSSPSAGGTTSGGGTYNSGSTVTVAGFANSCY